MSDVQSTIGGQSADDPETIRCRICNQSGVKITVNPWKGEPIALDPGKGHMFALLPDTRIRVHTTPNGIAIRLFGDPIGEPALNPIRKHVGLTLMPDTVLELVAQDLTQITVRLDPEQFWPGKEVKCGEG